MPLLAPHPKKSNSTSEILAHPCSFAAIFTMAKKIKSSQKFFKIWMKSKLLFSYTTEYYILLSSKTKWNHEIFWLKRINGKIRLRIVIQTGKTTFSCSFSCINPSFKSFLLCLTWTKVEAGTLDRGYLGVQMHWGSIMGYKKGKAQRWNTEG